MASKIEICNMALYHIGQDEISDLDEGSTAALACRQYFDFSRKAFLRKYPMAFSVKRRELADAGDAPTGWTYRYKIPNDCLRPLAVVTLGVEKIPFDIESGHLLTDQPNAVLQYAADITDPNEFDDSFIEAFSYYLAAAICFKVTGVRTLTEEMRKTAASMARSASAIDQQIQYEKPVTPAAKSNFLKARA